MAPGSPSAPAPPPTSTGSDSHPASVSRRAWRVLAAALLVQTAVSMSNQAYGTMAPFLQADLGLSYSQVGLIVSYIYIGFLISATFVGWAADILGDRRVLATGSAIAGLAAIAVGFLPGGGALFIAAMVLVGAVGAIPTPAGSHAVVNAFPAGRRGVAMGIRQSGIPLGGMLAAAMLPPIAAVAGWRVASMVGGAIALSAAGICLWLYPPQGTASVGPQRLTGVGGNRGAAAVPATRPPQGHLFNRNVVFLSLAIIMLAFGQFALTSFLMLYLRDVHEIPVTMGAAYLVAAQLSGALGRVFWSGASDWWFGRRRRPAVLACVAVAVAAAMTLALLPKGIPAPLLALAIVLFSSSALSWHALAITLSAELASPGWEGRAVGLSVSASAVGIMVGPPLFGLVVDATGTYSLGWALLGITLLMGGLFVLPIRERTRTPLPVEPS